MSPTGQLTPTGLDIRQYLERKREEVDQYLQSVIPSAETMPTTLHESMRYSLFAGGKRVRPILAIAAAEAEAPQPREGQRALGSHDEVRVVAPAADQSGTIRDQVTADVAALAALGIDQVAAVIGGSMGGARALEWAISQPDSVRAALVLAVGARATADQIGTQCTQIAAIEADPNWQDGDYYDTGRSPDTGLQIARRFAHLTYRGELDLDGRFANTAQGDENPRDGGRYAVQSYLQHQGEKLLTRFDAGSYVALSDSLSSHDVGRDRGGVEAALRSCPVPVVVGGITSDRLYPLRLQKELARLLPGCERLDVIESDCGHDGFLIETEAVGELVRRTLELADR